MKKRSVTISGHSTSITLEEPFWQELRIIADEQNCSLNALVSRIDEEKKQKNLSSALRLYVLQVLKEQNSLKKL